jgi:hypothetical protein
MRTLALSRLLLAAGLLLTAGSVHAAAAKPDSATAAALKKITERYALTKQQIATLLDQRMHPAALPTTLPNPFYHTSDTPSTEGPATPADIAVPAAPDASDADTLAKYAAALKISGVVVLNGQPHLTVNSTLCKIGDVIPVGTKDHLVYLQIVRITGDELTLGLNEAQQVIRLKR